MGCFVGLTKVLLIVFYVKLFSLKMLYYCKCLSLQGHNDLESFPAVRGTVNCIFMLVVSCVFLFNFIKIISVPGFCFPFIVLSSTTSRTLLYFHHTSLLLC